MPDRPLQLGPDPCRGTRRRVSWRRWSSLGPGHGAGRRSARADGRPRGQTPSRHWLSPSGCSPQRPGGPAASAAQPAKGAAPPRSFCGSRSTAGVTEEVAYSLRCSSGSALAQIAGFLRRRRAAFVPPELFPSRRLRGASACRRNVGGRRSSLGVSRGPPSGGRVGRPGPGTLLRGRLARLGAVTAACGA